MSRLSDGTTVSDDDRETWVSNDEGLYDLMRRSRLGKRAWIRANRPMINEVIEAVTVGSKPPHYLKYGG
jgi:hypothetical protein